MRGLSSNDELTMRALSAPTERRAERAQSVGPDLRGEAGRVAATPRRLSETATCRPFIIWVFFATSVQHIGIECGGTQSLER